MTKKLMDLFDEKIREFVDSCRENSQKSETASSAPAGAWSGPPGEMEMTPPGGVESGPPGGMKSELPGEAESGPPGGAESPSAGPIEGA
jgi:hypothetical protein